MSAMLSAMSLNAVPITYMWQTTATGTIGTIAFENTSVTITATADTSNVVFHAGFYYNFADTAMVTIAGIGTLPFTSQELVYSDPLGHGSLGPGVGIGTVINHNPPEINGVNLAAYDPIFLSYDLALPFGRAPGISFASSGGIGLEGRGVTSLGLLSLPFSNPNPTTFTATTAAPEPNPLLITAAGLALIAVRKKRNVST